MNLRESTEFDPRGRWLRDQAKESFINGESLDQWHTLASQAVSLDALTHGINSREYAASIAMRARLAQRYELASGTPYQKDDDILESFRFAMKSLRHPGIPPDQYEINFAAVTAFREATHGSRKKALRLTGRSAILAACSESPSLARETNPDLSVRERLKAKGRAFGRVAIAAFGAVIGPKVLEVKHITRTASNLL